MNLSLKAIVYILFGILLVTASIPLENYLPGEYYILPCFVGICFGIAGLYVAHRREK